MRLFILFYFCREGSSGKDPNNKKILLIYLFIVKKELKDKVGITKKRAVGSDSSSSSRLAPRVRDTQFPPEFRETDSATHPRAIKP